MRNLTPWFASHQKPVRPGVYQRMIGTHIVYSEWDGDRWLRNATTPEIAAGMLFPSMSQRLPWRGVHHG